MNVNSDDTERRSSFKLFAAIACMLLSAPSLAGADEAITYERVHDKIIPGAGTLVYYGSRCGVGSDVDNDMLTLIGSMPVTASQSSALRSYWEQAKAGKLVGETGLDWIGKIGSDIFTSGSCSAKVTASYNEDLRKVHSALVADTQKVLEDVARAKAEKNAEEARKHAEIAGLIRVWGECIGKQIETLDDGVTDAATVSSAVMGQCELLSTDLIAFDLQSRHVEDTPSARNEVVENAKIKYVVPWVLKHRAANKQ